MCPSAALTPIDGDFDSTDENLFCSLERMIRGCPLPDNVINYVNPYNFVPSNLPAGIWFLFCSKENRSVQHGQWKPKEETCEIFSNSFIIGWRTTLEFYEGQVERKTDWVMQEFRIIHKRLLEDEKEEDLNTLCRVFLSGQQSPNHEMQQQTSSANITSGTPRRSMQLSYEKAKDGTRQGSTSRREVNDGNETRTLADVERPTNHPVNNLPETDNFSLDDFLELQDLVQPLSRSSSSDNSSCMTWSSDEYFDPVALLQELEPKKTEGLVSENPGYKYNFCASHTPNKVVMFPEGSLINVERSKPKTDETLKSESSMPGSATVNGAAAESKALKKAIQGQEAKYDGDEGPSSNPRNLTSLPVGGRMKELKRKYFCFMPF